MTQCHHSRAHPRHTETRISLRRGRFSRKRVERPEVSGLDRRRAASVVSVLLVLALAVLALPATAHFASPGLNGQLDLGPNDNPASPVGAQKTVTGKGFVANEVAQIFQCPYGATDLHLQCQPLGTAQTGATGGFTAQVAVHSSLATPSGPVNCTGFTGTTLCAVAAATYTPLQEATSMAQQHLLGAWNWA
jgi:hypothetical protein